VKNGIVQKDRIIKNRFIIDELFINEI
jgi:hypothetical protein